MLLQPRALSPSRRSLGCRPKLPRCHRCTAVEAAHGNQSWREREGALSSQLQPWCQLQPWRRLQPWRQLAVNKRRYLSSTSKCRCHAAQRYHAAWAAGLVTTKACNPLIKIAAEARSASASALAAAVAVGAAGTQTRARAVAA